MAKLFERRDIAAVALCAVDDPDRQRCTAKVAVRRYGTVTVRPCRIWPAPGEDRCWAHRHEDA